jgi:ABC-2 type transport system permease protein
MWERIKHMLIKEFIEVFRDPRMKAMIFVVPIMQLLIFSYAASTDYEARGAVFKKQGKEHYGTPFL